ncbi:MAG: tRNA lysidine(34) synthetase TilS, partial [Rubrobacteraceae bacterium]
MKPREFARSVRETSSLYGMDLSRPLVLVSGGPDSVALLRVISDLGYEPAALHANFNLRGEESDADAEFVRKLCKDLDVRREFRSVHLANSSNLQERAREERYRLAERMADELDSSAIAVGHTADDVAETVLMNLSRGSGLRGLSGIPPKRGRIVRPLIERSRRDILDYLDSLEQPYRTDSTNLTGKYARNRLRLEVLPLLEEMYPGAARNLARAANLAREDLEALEGIASGAVERRGGETVLLLERLEKFHPALLRHGVRKGYEGAAPEAPPLGSSLVREILDIARKKHGARTLDLPGGVVAAARFGREVAFYRISELEAGEKILSMGETSFAGWSISVREGSHFDSKDAARPNVAYLDAKKGPYRVRLIREGDTIRPLGLGGTKKVLRAMMDRKVPKDVRRKTPVLVDGGDRVVWVFWGELDEKFAV